MKSRPKSHSRVVRRLSACHLHVVCRCHPHLPELLNFMQYYTWCHAHVIRTLSACHPHHLQRTYVIRTSSALRVDDMSSAHLLHVICRCHLHLPELPNVIQYYTWCHAHVICMLSVRHPHVIRITCGGHMSSTHCLHYVWMTYVICTSSACHLHVVCTSCTCHLHIRNHIRN